MRTGLIRLIRFLRLFKLYREGFNMVVGARQGKNYSESINKGALRFILKHLAGIYSRTENPRYQFRLADLLATRRCSIL